MKTSLLLDPAVRSSDKHRTLFEIDNLLCAVLGAAFLGTGVAKIGATDYVIETFQGASLAPGLLVAIGLVEILAAVLTLIPTTRLLGTGLISTVMLGAIGYHAVRAEYLLSIIPVTALLIAASSLALEVIMRRSEPVSLPASNL